MFIFAAPDPGPLVEIRESIGAVEGEGRALRARFLLKIANHLPLPVDSPEVELELLAADASDEERLPGTRFTQRFVGVEIPGDEEVDLVAERSDLVPSSVPSPHRIRYRARIVRYCVASADLALLARLVRDGDEGDQRAALDSLATPAPSLVGARVDEIRRVIGTPPRAPTPEHALVLLLSIRGAAELKQPSLVQSLVSLSRADAAETWRDALTELAARMREGARSTEPRLGLLPAWARRGEPAPASPLDDAVVAALVELADEAVPELVRASVRSSSDRERGLAARVLHTMGRSSPRSQLDLRSRDAQLRWVQVLGELGDPERAAVLAKLATGRDKQVREAAILALEAIGPPSIAALFDVQRSAGAEARSAILRLVERLGVRARAPLATQALRFGVPAEKRMTNSELANAILDDLEVAENAHLEAELIRGLELLRTGPFDEGARVLDNVYAQAPKLYAARSREIATSYLRRAELLASHGNFDVALETLELARTIDDLPELTPLAARIRRSLLEGYLELSDLSRAEDVARALKDDPDPASRALEARFFSRKAELAYLRAELAEARNLVNRARSLSPGLETAERIHLRLLVSENTAVLATFILLTPIGLLYVVLFVRRRISRGSEAPD